MVAVNLLEVRSRREFPRDVDAVVGAMWSTSILERFRFASDHHMSAEATRALNLHEPVGPESIYFPDREGLLAMGIDDQKLATALDENRISPCEVGEMVDDIAAGRMTAAEFNDHINGLLGISDDDLATAAAHMPDVMDALRCHPAGGAFSMIDRALHTQGLCSCHVHFTN